MKWVVTVNDEWPGGYVVHNPDDPEAGGKAFEFEVDARAHAGHLNSLCDACESEDGTLANGDSCQECCPHDEHDHFICLQCGHEGEPSDYYDEDYGQER